MSLSRNNLRIGRTVAPPWWMCALWLLAALIAQVSIMHYVRVRNVEPSLILVAVVWYAMRVDSRRAMIFGALAGLAEDALTYGTGGAFTIATTLVAAGISVTSRGFFADSFALVATFTIVATLVRQLIFWIVMAIEGYPPGLSTMHFHQAIIQSVLNAAIMFAVMIVTRRFSDRYA